MTCKYAYDMGHGYKPLCERGSTPVPAHCDRCDYRYEELEHENNRLRELFEAILKCSGEIDRDNGCETCPMYDSDGNVHDRTWCVWRQTARDAGFDVPIQSPERTNEEVERLRVENTKLRELVKSMHGWLVVNCEKHYVIPRNGLDDIERDMRELGVEAGE